MQWLIQFFSSGIGKKVLMSLTGLFLILFLLVHLVGNLQLLNSDGGQAFNLYSDFMVGNPLIKFISISLYIFILLHAILGMIIWRYNTSSKGTSYEVQKSPETTWASKNMALLGILIFAFILLHMGDFWYKMKFTDTLNLVTYDGVTVQDLYARVAVAYQELWIVVFYCIGLFALSFHLWHGFQSAFQTLGLNHKKYSPSIKTLGKMYAILVPAAFAVIPIYHYFFMK
ncbi:MAG: succinate dehydrogenase cytochrome b subunit [Saprospiraceae bacterium]